MNLLLGYLELKEGSLLIGGRPIGEYDVNQLRQSMAVVLQETFLFQASIRENLTIGTSVKNENEIWEALTKANAAEFVRRLPGKLEYICGGSSKLSGGERQRLTIARLFLRNPSIVILDEATNRQDMESEHMIQQALERLRQGRTTITIAHRLNTIANADKILVFQKGHLMQEGRCEELVNQKGLYKQLFETQGYMYG